MPIRNSTWRRRCGIKREEEILMLLLEGDVHTVDFWTNTTKLLVNAVLVCVWMTAPSVRVGFEHAVGSDQPQKPLQAVLLSVPVPILLMWLPHVHSPASTELGKLLIRKKIVNHCFYRLPRTSPALHSTPNMVVWGEENSLDKKSGFFLVWITRAGQTENLLPRW